MLKFKRSRTGWLSDCSIIAHKGRPALLMYLQKPVQGVGMSTKNKKKKINIGSDIVIIYTEEILLKDVI